MLVLALPSPRAHIGDISVVPRRANRLQLPWPPRAGPTSFTSRTSHTSHLCAELTPGAVVLLLLGTLTRQHGEQTLQGTPSIVPLRAILQKLFAVVPAPNGSVWDPSHCRTCAVVGNSGRLKGSRHGLQIDAHHWVLRMNRAKTAGFEMDVGARTTHHFMYPESAMNLWPGVHLVLVPFKPLDLKWVTSAFSTGELTHTYTRVKQFIKADRNKVLILSPAFLKYIHENWTERHGRYPSTGFTALLFALHACQQVSVFGFGADSKGNWHHYWEENRWSGAFRRTRVHDADVEFSLIQRLAAEGRILFYQ
ncbi:CMP-N-acetylneuraminate-beta-galactosamide-alpha-2,3-sialyltransferase 2 isoform X5 [Gallus gallus]|uniref:CMP-N-acetylneuraminate-beta-galactosamide- alpha-2,3-sialyltransferase 2 isoform X5 n=1 Tax=Gallus gallus TaxID=9031 RepID=UPI001AEB564D|nr:CMP-N-acetylneuraminate-beta-galactosamide-alpha-2,3-sialyltransferase 2 isoform X5 [Gallus gallus]